MVTSSKKIQVATITLIVFYLVGLLGMLLMPALFRKLTPAILLITAICLFLPHPKKDAFFFISLLLIFVAAFVLEWMGTNTGRLFGHYVYGNALGLKVGSTPVIIGLNWIIVAYASLHTADAIAKRLRFHLTEITGACIAAALMLALDLLLEPIAPRLDYWYWSTGAAPLQNYTAWYFFGFAFSYWLIKIGMLKPNPVAWRLYTLQILFFMSINLFF